MNILFTDVEYLSMRVKIDSCKYHTDRLRTMNPIDHHTLASITSKSLLLPPEKGLSGPSQTVRPFLPHVQEHLRTVHYNKDLVSVLKLLDFEPSLMLVLFLFDLLKCNI